MSTAASQKALLKIITDETPGAPNLVFEFTHPTTSRQDLNMFRESIAQVLPKKATTDAPPPKPPPAAKKAGILKKLASNSYVLTVHQHLQSLEACPTYSLVSLVL